MTLGLADIMYQRFKGRRDTWAVQRKKDDEIIYFRVTGKEMLPTVYQEHLSGKEVVGVYPLCGEFCFFAALDIDEPDLELAQRVRDLLPKPNYLERSRSGHYHVWMFFKEATPVKSLEQYCREGIEYARANGDGHCNLYPLPAKGLGLLIALPLQGALVAQDLTVFLDDELRPVKDSLTFLKNLKYAKLKGGILDEPVIRDLYSGTGKTSGDRSQSGYDFSFCRALFTRGFPRAEVKRLLLTRPKVHSTEEGYIEKTLNSAQQQKKEKRVISWQDITPLDREAYLERLRGKLVMQDGQVQQADIFFATLVANLRTTGRPVWLLMIGPPGCGKTLLMMAIQRSPFTYAASSFRPTALISGWGMKGGTDMSLIPKLNGKILLVKDLSSLLSQHKEIVAEVFGLLRDAYDGTCSRPFATGVERTYTSRFGFIGATTPDVDAHWSLNIRLGERFLRYRVRSTPQQVYEKIERSLAGLLEEDKTDSIIETASLGYLKWLMREDATFPVLSDAREIGRLAQLGAILRTAVAHGFHSHQVLVLPEWEEATRYSKQLAKMALALAFVRGKKTNDDEEMQDLKTFVRDGMDARMEKICELIYTRPDMETSEVAEAMNLPAWTVRACLDDLNISRILLRKHASYSVKWSFLPLLQGQLNHFKLWEKKETK